MTVPVKIQLIVQVEVGKQEDYTDKTATLLDAIDLTVETMGHECVNAVCEPV